jgi:radical SAM protein with 4Fe4S-binding SPASM domain
MKRSLPLLSPRLDEARPIDRATRPIYAVWELTLRCDLACLHCSSRAGKAREGELGTEEALEVAAQLVDLGVREVTLIGGEVYLRDDWTCIVEALARRGVDCTIVSGGRAFTKERAAMAKDAGVAGVSISVDGLEGSHDRLRALRGSYQAALSSIATLRDAGVPVTANTQIGAVNLRDVPRLFERLVTERIHSWQVQITVAMGRAADHPELLLQPFQMIELMPMLAGLSPIAEEHDVRIWLGNNVGYFGPHEGTLRGMLPDCHRGSCGAGRALVGIEANRNVKGCPSLPAEYVGGNVRDARLVDLWERATPLRFTRDRTATELWGHCADCYYAEDCLAGCSWTAHSLFGRRGNNPFCHHRALELLRNGRRERLARIEAPPGHSFDLGKFELIEETWPEAERVRAEAIVEGHERHLLEAS